MLTLAEEILLLAHDERHGRFLDLPDMLLHTALAAAALMELALLGRIDTDLAELTPVDGRPTGEPLLDRTLARIVAEPRRQSTAEWLDHLRAEGPQMREAALARLIERGILRRQDDRVLWVFETRRYPMIDGRQQQEVKLRVARLLLSDEIPEPRDTMIVALAEACGLLRRVFADEELRRAQERIRQIIRLELLGRTVSTAVEDLQALVVRMAGYTGIVA